MNLKELAKSRGTNIKRIAEQTGIPASTLYAISQGESTFDNVGVSTFVKVADALGITVEQLYESPNVTPEDIEHFIVELDDSDGESEIASIYRTLDERDRAVLMATARALAGR